MFPDSKFSEINCGRTKAGYLIRLGIAPFVVDKIKEETADNAFAFHVDESLHHGKVRLEIWIVHFVAGERKVRYLNTKELMSDLEVKSFLFDTECKELKDIKLTSADAIFDSTMEVLQSFSLDLMKLVHVMTSLQHNARGAWRICIQNEERLSQHFGY